MIPRMGAGVWAVSVAAVATAVVACSTPVVPEDTTLACANSLDDDGDGAIDCADPDCAASDACELRAASCHNGLDDDHNGQTDCEQQSCRDRGFCDTFVADCEFVGSQGCPVGMGCYPSGDNQRSCALAGSIDEGSTCSAEAPAFGCKAGRVCGGGTRCVRLCRETSDCPRNSYCFGKEGAGVCTYPCFVEVGCGDGMSCVAFQRTGLSFASGGWVHTCLPDPVSDIAPIGTAQRGAPCEDAVVVTATAPSVGTPLERICAPGLICYPESGGAVCRAVCPAKADNSLTNCADGRCVALDPFDSRPAPLGADYLFGVCVP